MKIRIISPIVSTRPPNPAYLDRIRKFSGISDSTELDTVRIEKGPTSIECRYDETFAIPHVLNKIKEASNVDAMVVNCFADPGVKAGREITNIPILGPGLSSMYVASSICNKFSILTILKSIVPELEEHVMEYGLMSKLASIRAIDIPVLDLHSNEEKTIENLVEQGRKAIDEDGAEALILGCTGMTGMAEELSKSLGVYVVDPLPTAVKLAETLASLKLSHSKITYPVPPKKQIFT